MEKNEGKEEGEADTKYLDFTSLPKSKESYLTVNNISRKM